MSKLIAESVDSFINEEKPYGFQRGLEPRAAMGIGYIQQINDFIKTHKDFTWKYKSIEVKLPRDVEGALDVLLDTSTPSNEAAFYMIHIINTYNNFDKDKLLALIGNDQFHGSERRQIMPKQALEIMDLLLSKGAKFKRLPYKIQYIYKGGKLITLTPEEQLKVAINSLNFQNFKKLIDSGVKLTMGLINDMFKPDVYSYVKDYYDSVNIHSDTLMRKKAWEIEKRRQESISQQMKEYLRTKKLEDIIAPKDIKKLDKIKKIIYTVQSIKRDYPHGYIIYRVLKFINATQPTEKKIIEFIYDLGHGKNSFNPSRHATHWIDGYKALIVPAVNIDADGIHTLNAKGIEKLAKLEKKFGTMKIDPPPYI